MNQEARRKLMQARTNLLLLQPFFGQLAMRLILKEDDTCDTAWTDGKYYGYNPNYVMRLSSDQCEGLTVHEVLHCANGHQWRRDARDHKRWNVACDYAIDPIGKGAGFNIPDETVNPAWQGKSAEWIYSVLPPSSGQGGGQQGVSGAGGAQQQGGGKSGQGQGQQSQQPHMGCGEVRDASSGDTDTPSEQEWQTAVTQAAAIAAGQGKLPANLQYLVKELTKPRHHWRDELRRFIQEVKKGDYSWRQPNRRYLPIGIYLPSVWSEEMPPAVIGWDCSGSTSNEQEAFGSEVSDIFTEAKPERLYAVYCDAKVQSVDEFEPTDFIEFHPSGFGGTDFRPVFDWVEENNIEPAVLIYFTDLFGTFPEEPPPYPVIWVSVSSQTAPWGETIHLDDGGITR